MPKRSAPCSPRSSARPRRRAHEDRSPGESRAGNGVRGSQELRRRQALGAGAGCRGPAASAASTVPTGSEGSGSGQQNESPLERHEEEEASSQRVRVPIARPSPGPPGEGVLTPRGGGWTPPTRRPSFSSRCFQGGDPSASLRTREPRPPRRGLPPPPPPPFFFQPVLPGRGSFGFAQDK